MKKRLQVTGLVIVGLVVLVITVSFILNPIIEKRIISAIHNELPENYTLNSFEVQVNSLKGNASLNNFQLEIINAIDTTKNSTFQLENARFSGLSYLKLLFSNHIAFKTVSLSAVEIDFFQIEKTERPKNNDKPKPFEKIISIQKLQIENSSFSIKNKEGGLITALNISELIIQEPEVNTSTLSNKIPFEYQDLSLTANKILFQVNPYDLMGIDELHLQNNQLTFRDFSIKTTYSKTELSRVISKERDHMDLIVPKVLFEGFLIGENESNLTVNTKKLSFKDPVFRVYRDKLVTDDTSIKPLYSKSLRELPFRLTIDSVMIQDAQIVYEEKVHQERPPGLVRFSNLNAKMGNLGNTYPKGEKTTIIDISAQFMDESPLKINWRFDVNDTRDRFQIQGEIGKLNASRMNAFTISNLNIETEGELQKTYFNINGDNDNSTIDFRINYDNFKVDILTREQTRNRFLSAVANIFIKKNTGTGDGQFKEARAEVTRNKDKSAFNYLWINIEAGLKKTMIGI